MVVLLLQLTAAVPVVVVVVTVFDKTDTVGLCPGEVLLL